MNQTSVPLGIPQRFTLFGFCSSQADRRHRRDDRRRHRGRCHARPACCTAAEVEGRRSGCLYLAALTIARSGKVRQPAGGAPPASRSHAPSSPPCASCSSPSAPWSKQHRIPLRLNTVAHDRLARNLAGLPQFANLAFQRLHPIADLGGDTGASAAIDPGLHPLIQRLRHAADLPRRPTQRSPIWTDDPARDRTSVPRARRPRAQTCSPSCSSWPHHLSRWSL